MLKEKLEQHNESFSHNVPSGAYMCAEQLEFFRNLLAAEKSALLKNARKTGAPRWDEKYSQISPSWRTAHTLGQHLQLVKYPEDIRKAICITNTIESLNSAILKATKKRKLFPIDDSTKKLSFWRSRKLPETDQYR